ncbi:MAG: nucleotidyl transferase AbiEii/AbiGii toxin family protein [Candidatus Woesearchaeota archaeon]
MITQKRLQRYIQFLKKQGQYTTGEEQFEKDYRLSLFLSELAQAAKKKEIQRLQTLVFKGGTLLTKAYLKYHRISEDLDFTHPQCNDIRELESIQQQERVIKHLVKELFDEIELIAQRTGLDFVHDRTNKRYVQLRNSRAIYVLHMHYISTITNQKQSIKLEISFTEELQNKPVQITVPNLPDILGVQEQAQVIGVTLHSPTIPCYPKTEIALEKFRAILTREQPKERDILDMYLLNKQLDLFEIPVQQIIRKIQASKRTLQNYTETLTKNCTQLQNQELHTQEDVQYLSLQTIDKQEYQEFKKQLFTHLKQVCSYFYCSS